MTHSNHSDATPRVTRANFQNIEIVPFAERGGILYILPFCIRLILKFPISSPFGSIHDLIMMQKQPKDKIFQEIIAKKPNSIFMFLNQSFVHLLVVLVCMFMCLYTPGCEYFEVLLYDRVLIVDYTRIHLI